eukprot:8594000-Pyramimonas_sp.AAC.1
MRGASACKRSLLEPSTDSRWGYEVSEAACQNEKLRGSALNGLQRLQLGERGAQNGATCARINARSARDSSRRRQFRRAK